MSDNFWKAFVDFAVLFYHYSLRWNSPTGREFRANLLWMYDTDLPWKFPEKPQTLFQNLFAGWRGMISRWQEAVLRNHIETSDIDGLKSLFNHGLSVHTEIAGQNLLGWAIEKGDPRLALFLVANGADPHSRNRHGQSILCAAIGKAVSTPADSSAEQPGFLALVEALLEKGADTGQMDDSNETPLYKACYYESLPLVKTLVEHGADIHLDNGKKSLLTLAVINGSAEIARYLLAHGAQIIQGNDNEPLLSIATEAHDLPMVELLLEAGANPQERDPDGYTPFFYNATFLFHEGIADALLRAGVDINALNDRGEGVLHIGIYSIKDEDAVRWLDFLLKRGANIDMKNFADITPLRLSRILKKEALTEYLLTHGAS